MKSIGIKGINVLLFVATMVLSFGFTNSALALEISDVLNPVNEVGELTNPGDVKFTKTVNATDEEGVYTVSLNVKGLNKVVTSTSTTNIYTVVVLDTSGSMCSGTCYHKDSTTGELTFSGKYGQAVEGAKAFSTSLLAKYPSSQLALVTFDTSVDLQRDFASTVFVNDNFPRDGGLTELGSAIEYASNLLLQKKTTDANAKLYMVILSDGSPTDYDYDTAATNAKNNGIEIFTIGYNVGSYAKGVLQGVATDENHYFDADTNNVVDSFTNISSSIDNSLNAGTNAVITDVIGSGFTYVDGSASLQPTIDGQTLSFNIGNITENGTTIEFKIKVKEDLENGTYNTNNGASLSYLDSDSINQTKNISTSSQITIGSTINVSYETEDEIPAPKTGIEVGNTSSNSIVSYLLVISIAGALLVTKKLISIK